MNTIKPLDIENITNRTFEDITNKPSQQGDDIQADTGEVNIIFCVRFQFFKLCYVYLSLD